ncbi:FAD dependent oxidoreductase-domain-containing protein [Ilyonectria destructans]|nr:FAD dependent oxidoreductase-domain-containing protein [Ilyonectria destructans]
MTVSTDSPSANTHNESSEYDVAIVGGGFAGVGAAIGSRQAFPKGRILLLESESCLGGAGTHRGVYSLCGLYTCTDRPQRTIFEPEGMKYVLDVLMSQHSIDVLLHSPVVSASRCADGRITSVTVQERQGPTIFHGRAFVDASGDGDLAFHGGASVRYGNHGSINLGTLSTRFGGLKDANPSAELWKQAILATKAKDPKLKRKVPKVSSVHLRLPQSGDVTTYLASASYDARDSHSITRAEQLGKQQAFEYLRILRQLPGHEKMHLVSSGPNFGTRESRHINAQYQLRVEDINGCTRFDDVITICG